MTESSFKQRNLTARVHLTTKYYLRSALKGAALLLYFLAQYLYDFA